MLWFSSVVAVCMHLTRALCVTSGSRVAFVGMRTCGHPWCNKPAAVICFGQVHLCRSAIMGPYTAPISCYFPSSPSPDAIRTQISAAIRIQLFVVLRECVIILFQATGAAFNAGRPHPLDACLLAAVSDSPPPQPGRTWQPHLTSVVDWSWIGREFCQHWSWIGRGLVVDWPLIALRFAS